MWYRFDWVARLLAGGLIALSWSVAEPAEDVFSFIRK